MRQPGDPPPANGVGDTSVGDAVSGQEVVDVVSRDASEHPSGVVHIHVLPPRHPSPTEAPAWLGAPVHALLAEHGFTGLWQHQREALDHLGAGRSVVVATGTASGKSLVYQSAAAAMLRADPKATALYLAPSKALGHDQARAMAWTGLRIGVLDGDTPPDEREWIAAHAQVVITNPDMLNVSVLPRHPRWYRLLRRLGLVVIDECHVYRGVFGCHTALVLRRLLRLAREAGAEPLVVAASATVARPAESVTRLTGLPVAEVVADHSPRGQITVSLLDPQPVSAGTKVSDLLAEQVLAGHRTLAFVPSRAGAERVAMRARATLAEAGEAESAVLAYRAGLLAEERRAIEAALRDGRVRGVASTNALELGVDITGLDSVLLAGWPGRRASFWQQIGRAGRDGQDATAALVADDDPLDHYLLAHPESIFGEPTEATVIDPGNPVILRQHLVAAAAEAPLTADDLELFGPGAPALVAELVADGVLRKRPRGVFWPSTRPPEPIADIRAIGGGQVRIVEQATGRLLGTVDAGAALSTVHPGAVYVHQGEHYLVRSLDLEQLVAMAEPTGDDSYTAALRRSSVRVLRVEAERPLGAGHIRLGQVAITGEVYAFQRRRSGTGELLSTHPLDSPPQVLETTACWWSLSADELTAAGVADIGGAAHAAEHAAISLLPLLATCDRWDIGGLSTALHPSTGQPTVFVYDGYPGGIGYSARGFEAMAEWLTATRDLIANCPCVDGCPRCVQSPKCGNGNNPLDKAGAVAALELLVGRR